MNEWARLLQPPDAVLAGLRDGTYVHNEVANRVTHAATGKFVSRLVPGADFQKRTWADMAPALQSMQLVSTVGALASVANLGVCCVGFAVVLHRLSRLEGKLDHALGKLDALQSSVNELHLRTDALSIARLRAAGSSLDRALFATAAASRAELARRARDLFQEARYFYLELWRRTQPWSRGDVETSTALELQGRFVACAIGEMQAEFIAGDMGAFRHATTTCAAEFATDMAIDPSQAFRVRSDAACSAGTATLATFGAHIADVAAELRGANEITAATRARLAAFELDAELPEELSVEPYVIARAVREATGDTVYAVQRP